MTGPDPLTRDQLKRWADQVAARTELPRLIRRLIAETTPELAALGMPASEGTSAPGWDGTVKATKHTPWVPAGLSLWEMSINKNAAQKASTDYEKRLTTPDDSPTSAATYIALSLRPWLGREQWAKDRSAEGRWKQVIAYGLDDVDAWLGEAPVTRAWLAEQMGFHPYGYRAAEQWWNSWASKTEPNLPYALVLAGRDEQRKHLDERFAGEPQITTIRGASLDEVLAFIVAVAQNLDVGSERLLARMAFVDRLESWRELIGRSSSLILIPKINELQNDLPASSPHHIIVPVTRGEADIELPRIDADAAKDALHKAGLPADRAYQDGRLARRSLAALRVHLAVNPELLTPAWAKGPPISRACRAVLLAGSWYDEQDGDQQIMCQLAGSTYENFCEEIETLRSAENPLLDRVGNSWHLVSIEDAWVFLREYLTKEDLKRLREACFTVLKERDPALDLDPADRWLALIKDKKRAYSEDLRSGLAKTLVLLSLHGQDISAPGGMSGSDWASYVVQDLLPQPSNQDADQIWISLADVLTLLAEAAPDKFIQTLLASLEDDSSSLVILFTDNEAEVVNTHSPHTNLLWALESLAWSPSYFGAVVHALADLDRIDPGGRFTNRPFATIRQLFCPWHINTGMPLHRRIEVLDGLRERYPELSWRLMVELINKDNCILSTYSCHFRDWDIDLNIVEDANEFIATLADRLTDDATDSTERFCTLVDKFANFKQRDLRDHVVNALKLHATTRLPATDQQILKQRIEAVIRIHRRFNRSNRTLSREELNHLESISKPLYADLITQNRWLFEQELPHIPDIPSTSDILEVIARRRREAVAIIYKNLGLDGILHLANECPGSQRPLWDIGSALWDSAGIDLEPTMLDLLADDTLEPPHIVAQGYFFSRFRQNGWDWLHILLNRSDISDLQRALLLLEARDYPKTWEVVANSSEATSTLYWQKFWYGGLGKDFELGELVARRLMGVNRPCAALGVLSLYKIRSEEAAQLAAQALEIIGGLNPSATSIDSNEFNFIMYHMSSVFDDLYKYRDAVGEMRLAGIEWIFFRTFDLDPPKTLRGLMIRDANFFTQIITTAFKSNHSDLDTSSANEDTDPLDHQNSAMTAFSLLRKCSKLTNKESERNEVSLSELLQWVAECRSLLAEVDRVAVGEEYIGQILASLPPKSDEIHPAIVVRDLLEHIKCQNIELGIRLAIRNSRGVTSRSPEDGGTQELDLAAMYTKQVDNAASRWPRTAMIFREIARYYDRDARSIDNQAERFRSGIDS